MACRGMMFAIDDEVTTALLAAPDDDAITAILERVESAWDEEFLTELDKSWDAMHRALGDGSLKPGTTPLSLAVLGGKQLFEGDSWIITLVDKTQVPAVAAALEAIDDAAMSARYDTIVPQDYAPEYGQEDHDYTVGYFRCVAELYVKAAAAGRAVVFSVDQ